MFSLGNLGGILYKNDTPIVKFKFVRGVQKELEVLVDDKSVLPVEFLLADSYNDVDLTAFFEDRITPDTRQGFIEELKDTPIKYYNPERIIRYQKGRCIHDKYWVDCDNDNTCWE